MRVLETERLLLRPVEESDLGELLAFQWDRKIMGLMNFKPLSMNDQKEWLKTLGGKKLAFSIILKAENEQELIGVATLNQIDHLHQRASWGMKLKMERQSGGIGFEVSLILFHFAFSTLNLHKISGDTVAENAAARKMCQNLGLREEGLLVSHYYQNGKFRDVVLVGILKEEFYKKNRDALSKLCLLAE